MTFRAVHSSGPTARSLRLRWDQIRSSSRRIQVDDILHRVEFAGSCTVFAEASEVLSWWCAVVIHGAPESV